MRPKQVANTLFSRVETALVALDVRRLAALIMGLLAIVISGNPEGQGTIAALAAMGISPRGYALLLGGCAMLIMGWPKSRAFTLLTIPYLVFVLAAAAASATGMTAPVNIIVYAGFYIMILRAGVDADAGH